MPRFPPRLFSGFSNRLRYRFQDVKKIFTNFLIGEPQKMDSQFFNGGLPFSIVFGGIFLKVAVAVNLNRQFCVRAEEIQNIRPDAVLTAELKSQNLPFRKLRPENGFCRRHLISKPASFLFLGGLVVDFGHSCEIYLPQLSFIKGRTTPYSPP